MTTNRSHRHRAVSHLTKVRCYTGPVGRTENRAAHGGVCIIDYCRCGAQRATNCNGGHVERGSWVAPTDDPARD